MHILLFLERIKLQFIEERKNEELILPKQVAKPNQKDGVWIES